MRITVTVPTRAYDRSRYRRPYLARLAFEDGGEGPTARFVRWEGEAGRAGRFVFEAEEGEVLMGGRTPTEARFREPPVYFAVDLNGRLVRLRGGRAEAEGLCRGRRERLERRGATPPRPEGKAPQLERRRGATPPRPGRGPREAWLEDELAGFTDEELAGELARRRKLAEDMEV